MKRINVNPETLCAPQDKLEPGDLVYVGLYVRHAQSESGSWWFSPIDGYVGEVTEHPLARSVYHNVNVPENEVNVQPWEALPLNDMYAMRHPLLVTVGERRMSSAGTELILYRTVELITPDSNLAMYDITEDIVEDIGQQAA